MSPAKLVRTSEGKVENLNRLASQVRRYIEKVLPQLERAGGFPDSPMDRKSKGTSNPPVGERALLLWWQNLEAGRVLNPLLEEVLRQDMSYGGYAFSVMLRFAVDDSAGFARWLSLSQGRRDAFWKMCLLIALSARMKHGRDLELSVVTNPKEEVGDPRKVAPKWRTITGADAYRSIVARLERIRRAYPGITEAAAEVECQKELEGLGLSGSIGRIRDAKGFVNKEREGAA